MNEVTRQFLISGSVQGVGYRAFAGRAAWDLGVRGWVRNLDDGRVEVLARAGAAVLNDLATSLRRGPPHGRVDGVVTVEWPGETGASLNLEVGFEQRKDAACPCLAQPRTAP